MNKREARTILGKLAAQWPHMDQNLQQRILQGFTDLERQAVDVLFMRDTCPRLPPELPQDALNASGESDCTTGGSLNEHRKRWQGIAEAGQVEVRRKPRKRNAEPEPPVADIAGEHRQRWQSVTHTGRRAWRREPVELVAAVVKSPAMECDSAEPIRLRHNPAFDYPQAGTCGDEHRQRWQKAVQPAPLAQPSYNAQSAPVKQEYLPIKRHRTGMGFWACVETVLVCLCMTPIPYIIMAWLLWLACSSQHYAPMY
jgi:hypothetical protein